MIRSLALAFLLAGCATVEPPQEAAEAWCDSRAELTRTLHKDFGEIPVYTGLTLNGLILEIFAPPDGRTFTLVVTHPILNRACVAYAGFGWKARVTGAAI